ncbi:MULTISPECIES: 2OG-Fe(II) oxygenase [Pseudoalteromonas]|jgi:SM-20-related protein|uniref:2OG-Fe(II) oxygenase n=1 Tax=Pseudoalteromonas lipolytica TaxID=570156 RepID=A0AAD0WBC8_9GAMM|nr:MULTISPECIES: 2OG-Fe(II) oxygenase [Pseudoalteromonas]AXV64357.1 2OG-Fe(II) oxygenase [Pseudoalteromonas donghaensis]EWH06435.1 proline hydroxylase [Pseudoalteromonas lipolytica SCSIO 04301]MBE0351967.1 SM-20-related protein [Pseudoalteromonas lipolytica LMEB 39]MCC9661080.1 2OG-Fe(II) oxygenase [Pseudoalteromonas sp. MB41]QLJ08837.1 2OG-Fe(II) oxygenase [Pseudoalteromonas sp. JSTW]|tara:strand:- start:17234 stop:17854 length:621 start_codon:yes stop_codon:yes gene_type:complete
MTAQLISNTYLNAIEHTGYAIVENAIDEQLINDLIADCYRINPHFHVAGIGRLNDQQIDKTVRKDKTFWFDSSSQAQITYLATMEAIKTQLNREFFLGLFDYECHYAKYQQGDFYKKHYDAFKGRSNRIFTTVCYLNSPASGGELVIYKPKSKDIEVVIKPKAGTLVMFESERFMHEVLPADDVRYSIAGWFRKNASISGIIDPPR